jgi:hypothetical protein
MYLGRSLARLDRVAEAWALLDRAARDAADRARTEPRYEATRDSARAEADALRPRVAWLVLRFDPMPDDLAVTIDGRTVQRGGLGVALPFAPGSVTVVARADGFSPVTAQPALTAGETRELTLPLSREAQDAAVAPRAEDASAPPVAVSFTRQGPVRTAGLLTGIAGLLTLSAGTVFGIVALGQYETLSADVAQRDLGEQGIRNRDTANALFVVGGVAAATGLLLWILAPQRPVRASASGVALGPGGLTLRGVF